ncbi:MAG TPA: glycoside hydrolase family 2 TIM barrel-domain containing protein, partial [Puia sp.]|nr:glycoside hydrolase family 2 TIM barrel-domain containing protein [Puia sp.]
MTNPISRLLFLAMIPLILQSSCREAEKEMARSRSFNADWRFTRDSIAGAEQPGFNDSGWRTVDLPHDWSIEDLPHQEAGKTIGPFSKESPGAASTGHTIGGTGWYRKTFTLGKNETGKRISLYFEGVYMESDLWINGQHAGYHPYGYTSFAYDITKYCKPAGEPNIIAMRVRNTGKNSRWYSGSGIYRNVWLTVTDPLHIAQWGVRITPEAGEGSAAVNIQTSVANEGSEKEDVMVRMRILDKRGRTVADDEKGQTAGAGDTAVVSHTLKFSNPLLWSPDSPYLYRAEISLVSGGIVKDRLTVPFGIRTIRFSAEKGMLLNGQSIKLKGGCVHQDNGPLGAAAIDRAEERRIELLKANGFNAIRCSHNPPSEKLLEACDRLGMMVIDECFDQWEKQKNPDDYHRFFDEYWEKDFSSMILRDRNHPSVILWSLGNEIPERADSSGLAIAKKLKAKAAELDPSRQVTEAICDFWDNPGRTWKDADPAFALLDVGGYNYMWRQYEPDHQRYPNRIMVGTESVPQEAFQNWALVEKHPYIIGDFVWTAMDYLGESGIGHTSCDTASQFQLEPWPWF